MWRTPVERETGPLASYFFNDKGFSMSRKISAWVCLVLLSIGCLAQTLPTDRSLNREIDPLSGDVRGPSQPMRTEPSISIARLRVPGKVLLLYENAQAALRSRQYAKAQETLTHALQRYPDFPEALTMLGFIQVDLKQWDSAEKNLQAAVRSDPTYGLAYLVLSNLYNRERRFEDALAMSQQALALIPGVWSVHYEKARALIGKREYASALNVSDAALRTNRGTLLHMAKAQALLGLERYSEAAAELQIYLQYHATDEASQEARGLLYGIQSVTAQWPVE